MLLLTEGRASVRLEFDSASGDPMPRQLVTGVAQKRHQVRAELTDTVCRDASSRVSTTLPSPEV